ncbi:MAG: N-acetylmuramoyl-L-alanine amidase [Clostridia bacterium]|nr:N-acetylmuramoyl-L-alanine amidase [Clostridia bacterium]
MPTIYLSPSTQEFNPYNGGGNEEYYMNLIADAMEPYLAASGIQYVRNTPEMTAATSIAASNSGNYDLHFALHSNATGSGDGSVRGSEVYYFPTSEQGKRFADIVAENLQLIYPLPDRVRTVPTTTLGEVRRVKAPGVLVEIAYHDNFEDAQWIRDNIDAIAANLVLSLTEYFGIPFNTPQPIFTASVATRGSNLNIRYNPSTEAQIIGKIPNGAEVVVYAQLPDWSLVGYNGQVGYVSSQYLQY